MTIGDAQHLQHLPGGAGSQHTQAGQIGRMGPIETEIYILHQTNPLELFMIVYIDRLTSSVPLGVEGIRAALLCDRGRRSSREKTMTFTKMDFSL